MTARYLKPGCGCLGPTDRRRTLTNNDDSQTGFAYDGSGSLVFDGGHFYVYDAWNRLTEVRGPGDLMVDPDGVLVGTPGLPQERFRYDALGRKVVSEVLTGELAGVTRHVYGTGAAVLAEYDVTTDGVGGEQEALARWFVHGEGFPEPLVLVDVTNAGVEIAGTSEVLYYLTDGLGSVGMLADAAGAAAELYMYTPYGPTTIAGPVYGNPLTKSLFGNPLAWTGQRYSPTTALYHFWARSYSPLLGRFLQEDMRGVLSAIGIYMGTQGDEATISAPLPRADAEYGDGMLLYRYVRSRPTCAVDATGLFSFVDLTGASGLAMDLESNNTDTAMSLLGAMQGLAMILADRNLMLTDLAGIAASSPDTSAIDSMLTAHENYQRMQLVLLAGGALAAGSQVAFASFRSLRYVAKSAFKLSTLFGKTEKQVLRMKPNNWKRVASDRGSGWKLLDEKGKERIRFMRPNPEGRWSHERTGYWRWNDEQGNDLDEYGSIIDPNDPYRETKRHIPYTGVE